MSTDGPILVAPRPVRLAITPYSPALSGGRVLRAKRLASAPVDLLERMQINEETNADNAEAEQSTSASPFREPVYEESVSPLRSSPNLAAEAWEDFLSVLKPAMDQPLGSTNLFAPLRRTPSFAIDRSYRISPRLLSNRSNEQNSPRTPPLDHRVLVWPLGSPVSRKQTRNPFQRHPSYDVQEFKSPTRWSPVARPSAPVRFTTVEPQSPTSIPLPSPTTSEILN